MAEHGKLRTNVEYFLVRIVLGFFSALSLPAAINFGCTIGRIGMLVPKLRRTGQRNLELAFPHLDENERARLLRGCYESLGAVCCSYLVIELGRVTVASVAPSFLFGFGFKSLGQFWF